MARIAKLVPWGEEVLTDWLPINQIVREYRTRWMGCIIIIKK